MTILPKGRVLLIDDEPLVLEMFESILSEEGYDVFVASSSKGALAHLERTFFDVLVCDVKLEEFDGFDIMAIARRKHPQIGVVLITGAPSETDSERARALNSSYLSKPIGFDLLISTVEQTLNRPLGNPGEKSEEFESKGLRQTGIGGGLRKAGSLPPDKLESERKRANI